MAGGLCHRDDTSGSRASHSLTIHAAFSPSVPGVSKLNQHPTIVVEQRSPLLLATPPQITRALAYANPFISFLNRTVALISWTSGNSWESFLLLSSFWVVVLYFEFFILWAAPIVASVLVTYAVLLRRRALYSNEPTSQSEKHGHHKGRGIKNHQSLDGMVDSLNLFTSRCSIIVDPFLRLTDKLTTRKVGSSNQSALTIILIRLLIITPLWIIMGMSPFRLITCKRVILVGGTIFLSWNSSPVRVCRTVMWRSRLIRQICSFTTGLPFDNMNGSRSKSNTKGTNRTSKSGKCIASSLSKTSGMNTHGIKFTFSVYENQRRWLGIGWTSNMLTYERSAWTDEHLNPCRSKDKFLLPEVEDNEHQWRWIDQDWRIDYAGSGVSTGQRGRSSMSENETDGGWIYYDGKWRDPRPGRDGWGRYTRRRKWCRDAELVEKKTDQDDSRAVFTKPFESDAKGSGTDIETNNNPRSRSWFRRSRGNSSSMDSGITKPTSSMTVGADATFESTEEKSITTLAENGRCS